MWSSFLRNPTPEAKRILSITRDLLSEGDDGDEADYNIDQGGQPDPLQTIQSTSVYHTSDVSNVDLDDHYDKLRRFEDNDENKPSEGQDEGYFSTDDDEDGYDDDGRPSIVANLVGSRFNYMERVAKNFMKQVTVTPIMPMTSSSIDAEIFVHDDVLPKGKYSDAITRLNSPGDENRNNSGITNTFVSDEMHIHENIGRDEAFREAKKESAILNLTENSTATVTFDQNSSLHDLQGANVISPLIKNNFASLEENPNHEDTTDGWGDDVDLDETEVVDDGCDINEKTHDDIVATEKSSNVTISQPIECGPTQTVSSIVYNNAIPGNIDSKRDRRDETSALTFDSTEINVVEKNLHVVPEKQDFDSSNAWSENDYDDAIESLTSVHGMGDKSPISPGSTFDAQHSEERRFSDQEQTNTQTSCQEKVEGEHLQKRDPETTFFETGSPLVQSPGERDLDSFTERTVDQIPHELHPCLLASPSKLSVVDDPSVRVLAASEDRTRDTGNAEFEEDDVYDDENEFNFGPIVDQTPTRKTHRTKEEKESRDSLVVLPPKGEALLPAGDASFMTDDADEEEEGANNDAISSYSPPVLNEPEFDFANALTPVVDHTPDDSHKLAPGITGLLGRGLSLRVCPSEGDTLDNTIMEGEDDLDRSVGDPNMDLDKDVEDAAHVFGPVVDVIPPTPAPTSSSMSKSGANSLAVNFATLEEDFREDAAMDETYYGDSTIGFGEASVVGGGSTVGISTVNDGWGDEDLVFDGDDGDAISKSQGVSESKKSEKKTTTFSLESNTIRTHVVDHTPSEFTMELKTSLLANPSIAALASSVDLSRESDSVDDEDVYEYENEHAFGQVVDHTPKSDVTPQLNSAESMANSIAAQASMTRDDTLNYDDALENTSYGGDSCFGRTNDLQDNDILLKLFTGDSASSAFGPGKSDVAVVDHTPSDLGSPSNTKKDPSVEVLPSEVNTRATEDADSTGESNTYGPMVDLTPSTPDPLTRPIRSDSVVVQAHDLDTVDETTAVGGSRDDDDDDEYCDDEDMPGELPSDGDKLVDHVPPRSEVRFGDASTVVAADPSEVISEVDDLAPEEQNFGPVVDVTPFCQPNAVVSEPPSGAASTAVFAPFSVAADDLDEDPATESQGEQPESWEANMTIPAQAAPNPQSGNDDASQATEIDEQQLVDFLPPVTEAVSSEADDLAREALSEMTVGGAQSLLQTGDPVEDDFGPVVDLTPYLPASVRPIIRLNATTESLAPSREDAEVEKPNTVSSIHDEGIAESSIAKVIVNPLPRLMTNKPIDSIATAGKSQISEEEEEEDDVSKFGPVVDQLPTSRISLSPSRGGSTVDALANVSEANSEYDGWDEDFDASLGGVSEGTGRQTSGSSLKLSKHPTEHDKNVSVRFDTSVMDYRSSESMIDIAPPFHRSQFYYEPDNGSALSKETLGEQCNEDMESYDDEPFVSNGSLIAEHKTYSDKSFAEADTPPSTPYRRPESEMMEFVDSSGRFPMELPVIGRLKNSDEALTILPVLHPSTDSDNLGEIDESSTSVLQIGEVPIVYMQALENEKAKCRILEDQLLIARSSMKETDRLRDSLVKVREYELQGEISVLIQTREDLTKQLRSYVEENEDLRLQIEVFQNQLKEYSSLINNLEGSAKDASAKELDLEEKLQAIRMQLDESRSQIARITEELGEKLASLQREVQSKADTCDQLNDTVAKMEHTCKKAMARAVDAEESLRISMQASSMLEQKVKSLENHQAGSKDSVDVDQKELQNRYDVLNDVVSKLQNELAVLQSKHEQEIQKQGKLLETEIAKALNLESQLKRSETQKKNMASDLARQRTLAASSENLAHELLSVAKERDALQKSLKECQKSLITTEKAMNSLRKEREILEAKQTEAIARLKQDVEKLKGELECLTNESKTNFLNVAALQNERDELKIALQKSESSLTLSQSKAEELSSALRDLELTSQVLRSENDSLKRSHELSVQKSQALECEIEQTKELLNFEIKVKNQDLESLGGQLEKLKKEASETSNKLSKTMLKISVTENELNEVRQNLGEANREKDAVLMERDDLLIELALIGQKLNKESDVVQVVERLETEVNDFRAENETLLVELQSERANCCTLKEQVALLERNNNETIRLENENKSLRLTIESKDGRLKELGEKLIFQQKAASQLENMLRLHEEESSRLKVDLSSQNEKLENELAEQKNEAHKDLDAYKAEHEARYQKLEMKIAEDSIAAKNLQEKLAEVEERCKFLTTSNQDMDFCRLELESRLELIRDDISEKEKLIDESSKQMSQYAKQNADLAKLIEDKNDKLSALEARIQERLDVETQNEGLIASYRRTCDDLQHQVELMTKKLEGCQQEHVRQCDSLKNIAENLKLQVEEKTASISNLEKELESVRSDSQKQESARFENMRILQTQTTELNSALQEAQERLSAKDDECAHLSEELASLRTEYSCLKQSDNLDSDTVTLALSLVRTEQQRADAMNKLVERRKQNQETMRLLSETMSNWYDSM